MVCLVAFLMRLKSLVAYKITLHDRCYKPLVIANGIFYPAFKQSLSCNNLSPSFKAAVCLNESFCNNVVTVVDDTHFEMALAKDLLTLKKLCMVSLSIVADELM